MNLVLNGVEAMKDMGGELSVTSMTTEDGQIFAESGIGLPAGDDGRIFAAFFTTKPQGTGIRLHDHRVARRPFAGERQRSSGATFQCTLPQALASH
jgi:C4-dicarboxylate-specific signal transduction histidine kinase